MFRIVFDSQEFIVFELKPMLQQKPSWTNTAPGTKISLEKDSRPFAPRMDWTIENANPLEPIEFKFQYHPFWKADWNGNPVTLLEAQNGNMMFIPPQHAEKANFSLIYSFKPWPLFMLSMLMCGCLNLLCLVRFPGTSPKQSQSTAAQTETPQTQHSTAPLSAPAENEPKNKAKNQKKKKRANHKKHG